MTAPSTPRSGLSPNVAGALAYLLGPITGIFFLVVEKENRFVRFHAMQSTLLCVALIVLGIALSILSTVLAFVPVLGIIVGLLLSLGLGLGSFVLWLLLMFRAYQGKEWSLPIVGPQSRRLIGEPSSAL